MTTTEARTYTDFVGKKVNITYEAENGAEPVTETGLLKAANSTGVMFSRNGKIILILNHEVKDLEPAAAKAPKEDAAPVEIKAKRVDPVTAGTVKRHLALFHATLLSQVNAMTPEEALSIHENQHSQAGTDAPHYHAEKTAKE